jgi:hypothetical protein
MVGRTVAPSCGSAGSPRHHGLYKAMQRTGCNKLQFNGQLQGRSGGPMIKQKLRTYDVLFKIWPSFLLRGEVRRRAFVFSLQARRVHSDPYVL